MSMAKHSMSTSTGMMSAVSIMLEPRASATARSRNGRERGMALDEVSAGHGLALVNRCAGASPRGDRPLPARFSLGRGSVASTGILKLEAAGADTTVVSTSAATHSHVFHPPLLRRLDGTTACLRRIFCFPLVLAFALGASIFVFDSRSIADPDMWWHLRNAEVFVQTHAVVRHDFYSFTAAGSPWMNEAWLG